MNHVQPISDYLAWHACSPAYHMRSAHPCWIVSSEAFNLGNTPALSLGVTAMQRHISLMRPVCALSALPAWHALSVTHHVVGVSASYYNPGSGPQDCNKTVQTQDQFLQAHSLCLSNATMTELVTAGPAFGPALHDCFQHA